MIIAYASGSNALPNESPPTSYTETFDPTVNLANDQLPADVQLYGNGVDSNDANPVFTFEWSILSQTQQDPQITLSNNGLSQNVTAQQINTWGNIRCFLVVTNQNSGQTSETDPLRAPNSAFVTIRVRSPNAQIQKMASGERNWHNDADEWADAIETVFSNGNGLPDHTIPEHTDVNVATGADLDILVGGGYANDPGPNPNPNGALHIHSGDQVDEATRQTRGTITVEDPQAAVRAINVETVVLTATIMHTALDDGSLIPAIAPLTVRNRAGVAKSDNLATWGVVKEGLSIKQVTVTMANGGLKAPPTVYKYDLVIGTVADFQANGMARANVANLTGVPAVDRGPLYLSNPNLNIPIAKAGLIGFQCVEGPNKANLEVLGTGLTVTVVLAREAS